MSEKVKSNVKKRNWAFVVYPESAPADWLEQLQQTGLACAISPLHDRDINADGTPKKPHWHVIVCYSGPTSYNVVNALSSGKLNGTIPQALEQVKGYYRYLTHEDNPEKAQYDSTEIVSINNFNILDYADLTRSELVKVKHRIHSLIREQNIVEYADLMDFLADAELWAEYDTAASNTLFFTAYLKSFRFRNLSAKCKRFPPIDDDII